jgi:hypothetical protein
MRRREENNGKSSEKRGCSRNEDEFQETHTVFFFLQKEQRITGRLLILNLNKKKSDSRSSDF